MRACVALLILVMLVVPSIGTAATNSRECKRMTKQIAHFEGVSEMARDRGNELWEAETNRHIGRLVDRRNAICPEYAAQVAARRRAIAEFNALLAAAAKAALKYFTFGAF